MPLCGPATLMLSRELILASRMRDNRSHSSFSASSRPAGTQVMVKGEGGGDGEMGERPRGRVTYRCGQVRCVPSPAGAAPLAEAWCQSGDTRVHMSQRPQCKWAEIS